MKYILYTLLTFFTVSILLSQTKISRDTVEANIFKTKKHQIWFYYDGHLVKVDLDSATNGQGLVYNSTTGIWKAGTISGGSGTDQVARDSITNILVYLTSKLESDDSVRKAGTAATAQDISTNIVDSNDVKIDGLAPKNFKGRLWINVTDGYIPKGIPGDTGLTNWIPYTAFAETSVAIRAWVTALATNASNISSGSLSVQRQEGWASHGGLYVQCDDGVWRTKGSGSGSGFDIYGEDAFAGTAQYDTVVNININEGDGWIVQTYDNIPPVANDLITCKSLSGKLQVARPAAAATDGLKYRYFRTSIGSGWNARIASANLFIDLNPQLESGANGDTLSTLIDRSDSATNFTSYGDYRPRLGDGTIYTYYPPAVNKKYYDFHGAQFAQSGIGRALSGYYKNRVFIALVQPDTILGTSTTNCIISIEDTLASSTYYDLMGIRSITVDSALMRYTAYLMDTTSNPDSVRTPGVGWGYFGNSTTMNKLKDSINILVWRYKVGTSDAVGDTLDVYVNGSLRQTVTSYGHTWDGTTGDYQLKHTIVIGNSRALDAGRLPTLPFKGKIFRLLGYLGTPSDADMTYLYTKLDGDFLTPHTP